MQVPYWSQNLHEIASTVFPHIRPASIISSHSLLENTTFSLHKIVRNEGIIRIVGIMQGRVLYEEISITFDSKLKSIVSKYDNSYED